MIPSHVPTALLLLLYFGALFFLFLYGMNCYIMIFLHRREKHRNLRQDDEVWKAWQNPNHVPRMETRW